MRALRALEALEALGPLELEYVNKIEDLKTQIEDLKTQIEDLKTQIKDQINKKIRLRSKLDSFDYLNHSYTFIPRISLLEVILKEVFN